MVEVTPDVDFLAKIIWEYHQLHHSIEKADVILVLCSNDVRVADYAAKLYLTGFAPLLVFSGGIAHQGDLLETTWNEPESTVFAKRAMAFGVPKERILTETKASNTGENVRFTKELLSQHHYVVRSVLVVQKPYMERRAFATIKVHWPEVDLKITSPPIPYDHYWTQDIRRDDVINLVVGDLQRIKEYPAKGYQIQQDIPPAVWNAYCKLVELGYTKHLLK